MQRSAMKTVLQPLTPTTAGKAPPKPAEITANTLSAPNAKSRASATGFILVCPPGLPSFSEARASAFHGGFRAAHARRGAPATSRRCSAATRPRALLEERMGAEIATARGMMERRGMTEKLWLTRWTGAAAGFGLGA